MTGRGPWDQRACGPVQPRTELLPCRMSFLIVLYVTNYSSERHPRPSGQKALGPKDPQQQSLVLNEGRRQINSEQGACHSGSSVPLSWWQGEDPSQSYAPSGQSVFAL